MNIQRIFAAVAAMCVCFAGRASADPLNVTFDPPKGGFTEERPDYLYFKEINATRTGTKEIKFAYTLYGQFPDKFPENYGVRYKVYFDLAGYETKESELKRGDFSEDFLAVVFQNPNAKKPGIYTQELLARSKVFTMEMSDVKINGDKIEFSLKSNAFSAPNIPIRMLFSSGRLFREPGRNQQDTTAQITPVYDLPERAKASTSGSISERLGGQ